MKKLLATLCLIAILPLPYAYYELLRPAISLGIIYLLIKNWDGLDADNKAISIIIAIAFNPIFPIHLAKAVWVFVDFASGYYLYKKFPSHS